MNMFFEMVGYLAGICVSVCFLPQTLKTLRSKEVSGLSAISYGVYSLGILSWVVYGFYLGSVQMVVFNTISLCFAFPIFIMILKYRPSK